jgi:thiol-disulfide isomerase/thioredoxin
MFSSLTKIILTCIVALLGFLNSENALSENVVNAPNFVLDGKRQQVKLSDHRGQIIYLDFWASWCQPCRKSFDWMNKMQARYGNEGLKIIAINLDEDRSKAEQFLKQIPASFEVAFDPDGITAETYRIQAMPSSFIIGKNGKVIYANKGFRGNDKEELEYEIRQSISKSTVAENR